MSGAPRLKLSTASWLARNDPSSEPAEMGAAPASGRSLRERPSRGAASPPFHGRTTRAATHSGFADTTFDGGLDGSLTRTSSRASLAPGPSRRRTSINYADPKSPSSSDDLGGYGEEEPVSRGPSPLPRGPSPLPPPAPPPSAPVETNGHVAPAEAPSDAPVETNGDEVEIATVESTSPVKPVTEAPASDEDSDEGPVMPSRKAKGKGRAKKESESEYDEAPDEVVPSDNELDGDWGRTGRGPPPRRPGPTTTRSGRSSRPRRYKIDSDSGDDIAPRARPTRTASRVSKAVRDFVEDDEEDDDEPDGAEDVSLDPNADFDPNPAPVAPSPRKPRDERAAALRAMAHQRRKEAELANLTTGPAPAKPRQTRNSRAAADEDDVYEESPDDSTAPRWKLRDKKKAVNYDVAKVFGDYGLMNEAERARHARAKEKAKARSQVGRRNRDDALPFSMTGAQLSRFFGERDADSSDSDRGPGTGTTPRKASAARMFGAGAFRPGGGMFAGGAGFDAGAPSNLGRVTGASSASPDCRAELTGRPRRHGSAPALGLHLVRQGRRPRPAHLPA